MVQHTLKQLLSIASEKGHFEVVKFLVDPGTKLNFQQHILQDSLSIASEKGHFEIVKLLLEKGTNLHMVQHTLKQLLETKQDNFDIQSLITKEGLKTVPYIDKQETKIHTHAPDLSTNVLGHNDQETTDH
jgi:ankyrin repeat protein